MEGSSNLVCHYQGHLFFVPTPPILPSLLAKWDGLARRRKIQPHLHQPSKQSHSCWKTSHLRLANFPTLKNEPISESSFPSPSILPICSLQPSLLFQLLSVVWPWKNPWKHFQIKEASRYLSVRTALKGTLIPQKSGTSGWRFKEGFPLPIRHTR